MRPAIATTAAQLQRKLELEPHDQRVHTPFAGLRRLLQSFGATPVLLHGVGQFASPPDHKCAALDHSLSRAVVKPMGRV
eukprot:284262-Amphidinium_carterae.4